MSAPEPRADRGAATDQLSADAEQRVDALVEHFLEELQAGKQPDRSAWVTAHPELGPTLGRRLALVEAMARLGPAARPEAETFVPCPHCGSRTQVAEPNSAEITCHNCGSTFPADPAATASYRPATLPQTIGRFAVEALVGRGAFGSVYKARDPELDRVVAVKVPRAGHFQTAEEEERFLREARSAARLKHPGIVPVHEVGRDGGLPYIVSEFVDGLTLADMLTGPRLSFQQSAELVARVADALDYAHREGVVHRDVKPANILMAVEGGGWRVEGEKQPSSALHPPPSTLHPKITDFGLARRDDGEHTVTVDGQILGTPAYMAPEQAAGEAHRLDGRSDVYSLGVVLYELLTGVPPFRGNRALLLHQVLHDEPKPPRRLEPRVPRDLETICLEAMAREPGRRYASAGALAEDLRRFLNGDPIQARPVGRVERAWRWAKRRPALAALALVLAVGLPVLAGPWYRGTRAQEDGAEARTTAELRRYGTHAAQVVTAWQNRDPEQVRRLLDEQVPADGTADLRGFEWHYFHRALETSRLTLKGHADDVTAIAFSPDHRLLASGSRDGEVKVWELPTGLELRSLPGHVGGVAGLGFDPDGRRIATIAADGSVRIWEAGTDKQLLSLGKQTPGPGSVAFQPHGRLVVVAGQSTATIYDESGKEARSLPGSGQPVTAVAFDPKGRRIAAADAAGTLWVWDAGTGAVLHRGAGRNERHVELAFAPDGRRLHLTTADGGLAEWELENRTVHAVATVSDKERKRCAWSADGKQLALRVPEDKVRVCEVATGRELCALPRHQTAVTCVVFSPDGDRLATATADDHAVTVWSTRFGLDALVASGQRGEVFALAYSPDGKYLATGGADGTLRLLEADTDAEVRRLRAHAAVSRGAQAPDQLHVVRGVCALAFSRDGGRLATGGADGLVKVWDAATGGLVHALQGHGHAVSSVAFSPDGRLLASSSWDRSVRVWDAATGALRHSLTGHRLPASRAAFSPDGKRLASTSWDQTIRLWDPEGGQILATLPAFPGMAPADSLSFHPDGRHLAAASNPYAGGGEVRVFDADTGATVHALRGHVYGIYQAVYSADGRRLASVSCDGGLKVWDAATGQELFAFQNRLGGPDGAPDPKRDAVHAVAFSPDGRRLALGCRNGRVLVLDGTMPTGETLVRREAGRLVRSLFAERVTRQAVLEQLRGRGDVSEAVRREALARGERFTQDAGELNDAAWDVVRRPGQTEADYRRALLRAEEACRLAPGAGELLNTLGVAQYRAGQYRAAVETLSTSDRLQRAKRGGSHPADLAFLALSQHRLGNAEQARAWLDKLHATVNAKGRVNWNQDPEVQGFLREANAALGSVAKK